MFRSRGRLASRCTIMTQRQFPDLEAASFISKHSVALLLHDQSRPGGVRPVGSGSLVTFDGRHFIFTATHVWAAFRRSSIIYYSAIAERFHGAGLDKYSLTPYSLDDKVRHPPQSGWLSEWGRLKGGRPSWFWRRAKARLSSWIQKRPSDPSASSWSRM